MDSDDRAVMAAALPRYDFDRELGRGAWGVVYAAHHRDLGRQVAVKRLPPSFAVDADVRERFRAEARVVAGLAHPHIVSVHDFVEQGDVCLLVMERLDGGSLWDRSRGEGLTTEESCAAALAACAALSHAHGEGVLHRDIKPQNLLFTGDGTLKVADFGIAKVLGGTQTMGTVAGQILGTPTYMSPEQALGGELGPATDVYAVGTVLYELLTGRLPFVPRDNAIATLYAHAHETPIPLAEIAPEVPDALAACVMRAIERDRSERYRTADEFGSDLATATNELWDTGWIGRNDLVVVPTPAMAHQLSLPPRRRRQLTPPPAVATSPGREELGTIRTTPPHQGSVPPDRRPPPPHQRPASPAASYPPQYASNPPPPHQRPSAPPYPANPPPPHHASNPPPPHSPNPPAPSPGRPGAPPPTHRPQHPASPPPALADTTPPSPEPPPP